MRTELPRGLRNNNPGNIRRSSDTFQGEKTPSSDQAFKQFQTMAYGYRAIFKILANYSRHHQLKTIRQMIGRWAPANENNTSAYVSLVSSYSGIPADAPLDIHDPAVMTQIVAAMSRVENGRQAVMADVIAGWELL